MQLLLDCLLMLRIKGTELIVIELLSGKNLLLMDVFVVQCMGNSHLLCLLLLLLLLRESLLHLVSSHCCHRDGHVRLLYSLSDTT